MINQNSIFLNRKEVANLIGVSLSTLDRFRIEGDFPKPRKIGVQAIRFMKSDIENWIDSRPTMVHYKETL